MYQVKINHSANEGEVIETIAGTLEECQTEMVRIQKIWINGKRVREIKTDELSITVYDIKTDWTFEAWIEEMESE